MSLSFEDLPIRDDLRGMIPYGAPQAPLPVALNVNENTHPVPAEVASDILAAVDEALRNVNRYPDREFTALREAFAGYLGAGLRREQIWAANGSNEVLQHVLQAFGGPGRRAFGFAPTYSMYPLLTRATGATWVAGERSEDYSVSAASAAEQVAAVDPDVVFLCAPNNPTGTPLGLDVVTAVYEASRGIVIVDEAYQEFAPHGTPSAVTLLPGRERLVVSRTMSKAFAFAGARVGYLAADPAVIDALRLVRLPYHLSALTQAAATAALGHASTMLAMVDDIVAQRDRISARLAELGYRAHASWTNFVLFGGVSDPDRTWRELYQRGVLIRDVGIPHHLRVTAGTEAETTAFLDALASIDSNA
ncbi:histidinol-phosphate transaminase [Microbacterium sp. cx-55]|uniref:histidinol-phosphate transaminase n=1 Tax=unclassified Microbacterium TaxID=2609290 RepID=UPI001CBACF76|nr:MULTISPECIES: histidinol-phosphate transaminase [unclassified Microbacterium]MBZ4488626.1 histidinol-phosphate transaminase [Microbacterium sp. cx-55]MCC4909767.1 histidinol-phosphate transaminase [Microbacterium sp. cx-59]UGB36203.1 histidinol-phosphate transaminase [Microbacterium sp. cx-55]